MNKSFVIFYLISAEYEKVHRKSFIDSLYNYTKDWSELVIVQTPYSILLHTIFRPKKFIRLLKGDFKIHLTDDGKIIFTPFLLFHYLYWLKSKIIFKIDEKLLLLQIKKLCRKYSLGNKKVILNLFSPIHLPLATNKFFDYIVYDFYDNHSFDYDGNLIKSIDSANKTLINISDIVFCTSTFLFEKAKKININSYYIPNGNDYILFSNKENLQKIDCLENKKQKIIGYFGILRNWIDFELLNYLMKYLNNVSFIFIGDVEKNATKLIDKISKMPNYKRYPFMQKNELISYIQYFDAAIIPYRVNEFTKGVYPLKFHEYIAAKLPVVTTALPDLQKYKDYIAYSNNYLEFLNNCKIALLGGFKDKLKHYDNIAKNNTWNMRSKEVNDILIRILNDIKM